MARIIVSYYKIQEVSIGKILCFWDGFIHELKKYGNEVFVINTAYFNPYNSNVVSSQKLNNHLLDRAKAFDPELIITFNHRIPKSFLDYFDVPIIIWDGDELSFFCDHSYMKKNLDRYKIFSISKGWLQDYKDFGFSNNQIFYVPQATAIQKMDCIQTMNISFLGIRHFHNKRFEALIKTHKYKNNFYFLVKDFLNTGNYDYEELFNKYFQHDYPELVMPLRDLYPLFDYRWLTLANMLDLGLTISGHDSRWEDVAEYMPQLAAAYHPQQIWTLEENNWFYNSSKISLCPVTAQARGTAFSWRVFDIMASNACLLISEASDLKKLTKDYLEIPMYKTPWEARELSKKILADEEYRKQIVKASQKYVDENARWIHRFRDMENIIGIRIVNEECTGKIYNVILDDPEIINLVKISSPSKVIAGASLNEKSKISFKVKKLLTKCLSINKAIEILEISALILLLGVSIIISTSDKWLQILGNILCWTGIGSLMASIVLFCIKIHRKIKCLK